MRCMTRNKRTFYYASYIGETEITDEYGNSTGEYNLAYSKPIKVSGNISAAQGEMLNRQFGESERYDKVIVLDDINTPIDEYAILWVDTLPQLTEEGSTDTPHDYIIKKVAYSPNSVSIIIGKVDVR
mgnify:FL=1